MSRRIQLLAITTFAGLVGVAVAVMVLGALHRPALRARVDLTAAGQAALSDRTVNALAGLPGEEPAVMTLFLLAEQERYRFNGAVVYPKAYDRLRSLAEDARIRADGRLEVVVHDAGSPLVATSEAAERLGRQPEEVVVLEAGGARRALRFEELFQVAQPRPDGTPARLLGERVDMALGDAALALGAGEPPRVGLLTGSGQGALDAPDGLAPLVALLERQNFAAVPLASATDIEDLELLVVVGQQRPFADAERDALAQYLDAGGALLLALGPQASPPAVAQWNALLAERGTGFGDGLVCQPVRAFNVPAEGTAYSAQLEVGAAELAPEHPATRSLAESPRTQLLVACRPVLFASGTNDWTQTRLARSGERAWVDDPRGVAFTFEGEETRGIVPLMVAAELWAPRDGGAGRTLVLGSAQALRGPQLAYAQDLALGGLRWLLEADGAGGLVGVQELPFRPSAATLARLNNTAVYAIPGITLLIGLWIWWRRRR